MVSDPENLRPPPNIAVRAETEVLKDDFEIKKPGLALIREAVEVLIKEGYPLTDLDSYDVAEKIQELKPDMARTSWTESWIRAT